MSPHRGYLAAWLLAICFLPACAANTSGSSNASTPGTSGSGASTGTSGSGGFFGGTGTGGATSGPGSADAGSLPPEQEVESSYEVPVATGRYVWIANPSSGRVAFVDASSLKVQTAQAGNAPTYLSSVPGTDDKVVVMNILSHDATVLRATSGQLSSTMIPGLAPLANAWSVSPDGRFALAWTNARRALAASPKTNSLEGFQDLTVIDMSAQPPKATTMAVGYRPVSVTFSADGRRAYAVTEDGISVVGLAGPTGAVGVIGDVALTDDPNENADTRDVSVTSDGRAVVRREGSPDVRIVDLTTGVTGTVTLSGPVTDLDVTSDGARAIAVVRQTSQVAILPLATAGTDPTTVLYTIITDELIGSVVLTADNKQALLYSNASDAEHLTVLDLVTGAYRVLHVHAPVLSLFPSPDGQYAVVLHHQPVAVADAGVPGSVDASTRDAGVADGGVAVTTTPTPTAPPAIAPAFSVIPLDGTRSGRIQETGAAPQSIAFAPNSSQALVTVRGDQTKTFGVYVVGLPTLQVTPIVLASPPIATGVVAAANRGYVAQSHPEGRITFIPFDTSTPQTLTGFDLGARVVAGVTP